jgi:hypothetical protein
MHKKQTAELSVFWIILALRAFFLRKARAERNHKIGSKGKAYLHSERGEIVISRKRERKSYKNKVCKRKHESANGGLAFGKKARARKGKLLFTEEKHGAHSKHENYGGNHLQYI